MDIIITSLSKHHRAIYYPSSGTIGLTKLANENNIVDILTHESIHHGLAVLKENKAYTQFDNLTEDFGILLRVASPSNSRINIESFCTCCFLPVSECLCDLFKDSLGM